jgi:hypothetical protein
MTGYSCTTGSINYVYRYTEFLLQERSDLSGDSIRATTGSPWTNQNDWPVRKFLIGPAAGKQEK